LSFLFKRRCDSFRMRWLSCFALSVVAALCGCTAGVAHSVAVILPTPHLSADGVKRQFGNLFFYTDRNIPDTSLAFKALLNGNTAGALAILEKIEASNLPVIQRAYWQNDVAVCFILDGRYREADELLLQAGIVADDDEMRHNHRVSVYLNESQKLAEKRAKAIVNPEQPPATQPAEVAPSTSGPPVVAPAPADKKDDKVPEIKTVPTAPATPTENAKPAAATVPPDVSGATAK
jgi:hypothetical protein